MTLENVFPSNGTPLFLEVDIDENHHRSVFVGFEPNRYVIIKNPPTCKETNLAKKYFIGTKVIIKYQFNGNVVGFASKIIDALHYPSHLLFVSYPDHIETYNLRSYPRYDCLLDATIETDSGIITGFIKNISIGGCCFVCDIDDDNTADPMHLRESNVVITIDLQSLGKVTCQAHIANLQSDAKRILCGIQFHEHEQSCKETLTTYISRIEEYLNSSPGGVEIQSSEKND